MTQWWSGCGCWWSGCGCGAGGVTIVTVVIVVTRQLVVGNVAVVASCDHLGTGVP